MPSDLPCGMTRSDHALRAFDDMGQKILMGRCSLRAEL